MASRGMGRTASTVGMMEGAFFVSRSDLLQWINQLLEVHLTKVEQCASGAIYCQILDACHPGTVAMRKVNWMAKSDHEFIPNYKVLQAAFDKNVIERNIDVDKLIRAKYQDNLEFLQWMKCYWERQGVAADYDPIPAREGKVLPAWAQGIGGPISAGQKENLRPQSFAADGIGKKNAASSGHCRTRPTAPKAVAGSRSGSPDVGTSSSRAGRSPPKSSAAHSAAEGQKQQLMTQQTEIDELKETLDGLQRERDFYFSKLRSVEVYCSNVQTQLVAEEECNLTTQCVIKDVQDILYSESEDVPAA
mmetsp:Transcript_81232/g.161134  ORF Transcript_81232/g.161134 Transcript_81232/m.161134 type:complete len:304 (-) Transcript_81232:72-983(-)|eukprot:CAMPEP_0172710470 /NCGR_PEP_ID=MMETSP1074-20121228/55677_1 /TAXON_ID=2916 /ORGANISM="Ceratium fusus, Strain PA161109" /LENGTH=303 /DNA_ID=CAMNT_0013533875 /DNA_START=34 /DNA_END=945 /DNA_ORIENTATION=-